MGYPHLFSPAQIGSITLRNRVLMPAMATRMAEPDYTVGKRLIAYHAARARGGCAMNITEFVAVHPTSHFHCTPALYDDKFIPGMRDLADALHQEGGRLCVQLWHVGRQGSKELTEGFQIVAPSSIPLGPGWEVPRELTIQEIHELVEAFGDAAVRAKQAGADAVEVHGAHGYLIGQFLSGWSNHRKDLYGGSVENRARFAVEILKNIREKVGTEFPVLFRLSAEERISDPNAMTPQQALEIAKLVEAAGADAIHVSIGGYCALWDMIPPIDQPRGFNVHNAAYIKQAVKIPVIAVGRINDPMMAEEILAQGKADFVSIGRAQLADPDFLKKAQEGRSEEIIKCIACNQGCIGRYGDSPNGKHLTCMRNPLCGHEFLFPNGISPAPQPKKVLVAGGGIGGLEAARRLKERGHQVLLCEKNHHCGGEFLLAGVPPKKQEIQEAMQQELALTNWAGVEIHLNTTVDEEFLEKNRPDFLVDATGATPVIPKIPGVELAVSAQDVLAEKKKVGKKVLILGGGLVGVETAEYLWSLGKEVTIVEMLDKLTPKADAYKRHFVDEFIEKSGTKVYLCAKCVEITSDGAKIQLENKEILQLKVDHVILAAGYRPKNLSDLAQRMGIPYQVIGDAKEARLAIDAIKEAFDCANAV